MIIWSGMGFIVAIIGFGSLLLTKAISEGLTHNEEFYQENLWVMSIGLLAASALTFVFSRTIGQGRPQDTLFFVETKWWPQVFIVLALICSFL